MQNDQLLEIEETMNSLRELHEYWKQVLTQPTIELTPVKNRPPTPLPRPNRRQILRNADLTLSQSSSFRGLSPRQSVEYVTQTTTVISIRILIIKFQLQRIDNYYNVHHHYNHEARMERLERLRGFLDLQPPIKMRSLKQHLLGGA